MGSVDWANVLGTVLPTLVVLGAGWIRTHAKVKQALDLLREAVDKSDDAVNGK